MTHPIITPDLLLRAYACGVFPMAESRDDPVLHWIDPPARGILPLDGLRVSHSLAKTIRRGVFEVTCDQAFARVIAGCAESTEDREETWINPEITDLFEHLHQRGWAHSVECWQDRRLVGGLYGLAIGGVFFGESMFSRATDASKVALVTLVARLRQVGFSLLDTQFVTPHLQRLGAIEIPRAEYLRRLDMAIGQDAQFAGAEPLGAGEILGWATGGEGGGGGVTVSPLQSSTHKS